jgi:hypothetical protein
MVCGKVMLSPTMKALPLFLFCLLLLPGTVNGSVKSGRLPEAIRSILNKRFPGWSFSEVSSDVQLFFKERFPGSLPNLIKGDFDGNGQMDYAVLIEHSNFDKSGADFDHVVEKLAFLRRGARYKLYVLEENAPANIELYLNLAKKGAESRVFTTQRKFRYPNDSISVSYFEKAGGAYIYQKGKFRYVYESD